MRRTIFGLSGCLLLATMTVVCPAAALDTSLKITIHIYDYSGIEATASRDAERAVEAFFLQAGIAIEWQNCPIAISKPAGTPGCGAGTEDVTHFVVSVLSERMSEKMGARPQQFGMSVMGRQGGFPTHAYVFMDRVVNFAAAEMTSYDRILGMVVAHELGHLLLGNNSHSPVGLMREKWNSDDVKRALMSVPAFSAPQTEHIRAEVRRRMNAEH